MAWLEYLVVVIVVVVSFPSVHSFLISLSGYSSCNCSWFPKRSFLPLITCREIVFILTLEDPFGLVRVYMNVGNGKGPREINVPGKKHFLKKSWGWGLC